MKYTKLPTDFSKKIQINAGILMSSFTPSTATVSGIIGATSGGLNFSATPTYTDFGADIDNCPKNTMEMKRVDQWEVTCSGTFSTVDPSAAKLLAGAAAIDGTDTTMIVPKNSISEDDFDDLWLVCDYSDKNEDSGSGSSTTHTAGFVAIHMMNTLSTGGFQMQTADKEKGKFSFTFTAHYSADDPDEVPFAIYVKSGT